MSKSEKEKQAVIDAILAYQWERSGISEKVYELMRHEMVCNDPKHSHGLVKIGWTPPKQRTCEDIHPDLERVHVEGHDKVMEIIAESIPIPNRVANERESK